ncbi:hypothetical protein DKP78_13520 [Enterococcus faecium]|nr:hypothetical protein DKP78_13520 [Enterococcus faecium]
MLLSFQIRQSPRFFILATPLLGGGEGEKRRRDDMKKEVIEVKAKIESLRKAKELLDDLEALNEKYEVCFILEKNDYPFLESLSTDEIVS